MITPLQTTVLIDMEKINEQTKCGIVIPQSVRDTERLASIHGKIIAVADGAWQDQLGDRRAKEGDDIIFAKYAGLVVKDSDDKEYRLLNDTDVLAIVTNGD